MREKMRQQNRSCTGEDMAEDGQEEQLIPAPIISNEDKVDLSEEEVAELNADLNEDNDDGGPESHDEQKEENSQQEKEEEVAITSNMSNDGDGAPSDNNARGGMETEAGVPDRTSVRGYENNNVDD